MIEIWKDIPGFEGEYQASSLGQIKSFMGKTPKILSQWSSKSGYWYVRLGAKIKKETHYWVAITFLGARHTGYEVNHIDFNRGNNNISNLEWVSRSENRRHALEHKRGNTVKLTVSEVLEIRMLPSVRGKVKDLCNKYNICYSTIKMIRNRSTWKWL